MTSNEKKKHFQVALTWGLGMLLASPIPVILQTFFPKKNPSHRKAFVNLEILNWCRSPSSGSRLVGHAEPHAGHCDLRDEQRDLPHFRKVVHAPAIIEEISIFTNFSLLSFYIPMVIMVTTYALTIHHLRLYITSH